MNAPAKILSGGQTGADLAALRAGHALHIPTGGWMPRHFRTELGPRPWYATMYGMTEHASPDYRPRTRANVEAADLTLVFGNAASIGTRLTIRFLRELGKPVLVNPTWAALAAADLDGRIVNVAGNRESTNRGIEAWVYRWLIEAWADGEERARLRRSAPWPSWTVRGVTVEGEINASGADDAGGVRHGDSDSEKRNSRHPNL